MKQATTKKDAYHHGDLRAALLKAGEAELIESGVEKFSLRGCARRAGVSHAAPMHHFHSVDGLLSELAAIGFQRLLERMDAMMAGLIDPRERLLASGCGYIAFATANPALFKLMFSSARPRGDCEPVLTPASRAFDVLRTNVEATSRGMDPAALAIDIAAAWSAVHGLSHLIIEGAPLIPGHLTEAQRAAMIAAIIERTLPVRRDGTTAAATDDQAPGSGIPRRAMSER